MIRRITTIIVTIGLFAHFFACKKASHSKYKQKSATLQVSQKVAAGVTSNVVLASEVKWQQLNPKRGDKSPKAATLWGDRNGTGPTGFLVKFLDGFKSPPHIHNVTYRGVVIRGSIHNDDPNAAAMWMPTGSFWTQPKGEVHITAAKGSINMAYIEIEQGPYLVLPTKKAFDSGERPVNIDPSNLVWLDASDTTWINQSGKAASSHGPKIAFLWGKTQDDQLNGTLVKLSAGQSGTLRSRSSKLLAVVIQGRHQYQGPGQTGTKILEPGSYFNSTGKAMHQISCMAGADCILYIRTKGKYDIIPKKSKN